MDYNSDEMTRFTRRAKASRSVALRPKLTPTERDIWPTADGLPATDLTLPNERRIAVVGDWESRKQFVLPLLQRIRRVAPDVQTLLHLGDLRWSAPISYPVRERDALTAEFTPWLDDVLKLLHFRRLILVPGNHEWWERLHEEFADHPGRFFRAAHRIWISPRGLRFELSGHTYLCMGGAASLHMSGGPFEVPTEAEIERAAVGGEVDVLLTHEALDVDMPGLTVGSRREQCFANDRLAASAASRDRVTDLYDRVRPKLAFFGHMHASASAVTVHGAVHCLNIIRRPRHVAILDIHTLRVQWLDDLPDGAAPAEHSPVVFRDGM